MDKKSQHADGVGSYALAYTEKPPRSTARDFKRVCSWTGETLEFSANSEKNIASHDKTSFSKQKTLKWSSYNQILMGNAANASHQKYS